MIPYEELAAALDRWRARNGLPTSAALFDGGPTRVAAPAPMPAAAPAATAVPAPAAAAPRTAPPSAPPGGRSTLFGVAAPAPAAAAAAAAYPARGGTETYDESVDDLADSDVVEHAEDVYDIEGEDFAMQFSG